MSDSRAQILSRLKRGSSRDEGRLRALQPAFVSQSGNLVQLLKQKLEAVHTSVDIVESDKQLEASIMAFLEARRAAPEVVITPALESLNLKLSDQLQLTRNDDYSRCQTVMTCAQYGIAETGTVVLPSSPLRPTLANFLPDNCIVLLDEDDIKPWLEDALEMVQQGETGMPRALNLISGPSKTADIEQTLVYGAHGPIQLHVVIRSTAD